MANNLGTNPWHVDTASNNYLRSGTTTPAPVGVQTSPTNLKPVGPIKLVGVTFSGYTTGNTDSAVLKDVNGNTFLTLNGVTDKAAVGVTFPRDYRIWDVAVTTLSSGIVTFFIG